jgi:hypothetical protein
MPEPVEITNEHLFASNLKTATSSLESQTATAAGAAPKSPMADEGASPGAASGRIPTSSLGGAAHKKVVPISIFVSSKLSRLFARQGFMPLFDVPIKIQNPEVPPGNARVYSNGIRKQWLICSLDSRVAARGISCYIEGLR